MFRFGLLLGGVAAIIIDQPRCACGDLCGVSVNIIAPTLIASGLRFLFLPPRFFLV